MINDENNIEFRNLALDLKSDLLQLKSVLNETLGLLNESVLIDNEPSGYKQLNEVISSTDEILSELSDDIFSMT